MNYVSLANIVMIAIGAVIMLASIVHARSILKSLEFVGDEKRDSLRRFLLGHRILMCFFFLGYIVVAISFWKNYDLHGELFVSLIFLFGAVFVFLGLLIQTRLLNEIDKTLHGLLPLCTYCNKVHDIKDDKGAQEVWVDFESYLGKHSGASVSHSICPECLEKKFPVKK